MTDFATDFDAFLDKQSVATGGTTAPAATPPPDGFSASFDTMLDKVGPAPAAKTNLFEANTMNPDAAAKAAAAARETGLPPETVERNYSEVEAQIKATRQAQAMTDNPALAKFYSDRRNAVVAHDDFDKLGFLSKVWQSGVRGIDDAVAGNAAARAASNFVGGDMDAGTKTVVSDARRLIGAPFGGDDSNFFSFVRGAAGFMGGLVDQGTESLKPALAGAIAGTAAGAAGGLTAPVTAPVGAAIGASVGFTAGMVADGFKVGAGQLYLALKDQKDANGESLDPALVKYAAIGGGAVLGLLNMVGARGLEKPISSAVTGAVNLFIKDAIAQPTTQRAFVEFGKGLTKSMATGAGLGAANESAMIAAETMAKTLSDGNWDTILNDPEQRAAALNRVMASMAEMSVALGAMHAAGGSVKLGSDMVRARQAEKDSGWVDRVNAALGDTATLERDRDTIKRFLALQADGSQIENVYVPAGKVMELYQSFGLDPFRLDNDPILGFMPDLHDQLREAEATKGDVVIPAKEYFARFAGTPLFEKLKGDIRIRPDGMSFNEARDSHQEREANFQRTADEWRAKMEAGEEAATPGEKVYSDVFGKLRAAGYTNDAAAQQAAIYASRYQSRSERSPHLGDAWEAHQRSGLDVRQVLPDTIRYSQPDQLDVLLNSLRSGKDPVIPKEKRTSLLEYISARGGVLDEGGELKARDLDKWHLNDKSKPIKGRSPLIADPGQEGQVGMFGLGSGPRRGMDDAALSAWEAGYFPEHSERPTINHLLEAIDEEARGRPRYSEDAPHDPAAKFREDRDELNSVLGRLGVDLGKMRNKDARKMLEATADGEGRDYGQPVYHGSPHVFDKFTLDHIGSGEGAQAFGWGLYFAGNKAVAKYYRETLARNETGDLDAAMNYLVEKGRAKSVAELEESYGYQNPQDYIRLAVAEGFKPEQRGRLYHVDIPEDGAYLHWDKVLSGQSPALLDKLEPLWKKYSGLNDWQGGTGKEFYHKLSETLAGQMPDEMDNPGGPRGWGVVVNTRDGKAAADKAASLALREAGVPGIQYLDGGSRGTDKGSHNYVLFDDALATIKQYEQEARGSIRFLTQGGAVVHLFQSRDLSTFLHETGHLIVEELHADAKHPLASDAVKADLATVRDHVGAKGEEPLTVEQHETLARSFETYLMEGKAPSDALRSVFQKFKSWLVAIYKNLASLNAPLSPELRGVFDRLIATDDEIAAARERQALNPVFASADAAGWTKAAYAAYTDAVAKARGDAEGAALNKVMADIRQRRTKEWKAEEETTREAVTRDTMREPGQATLHLLRTGKLWEGDTPEHLKGAKLSRDDIVSLYGNEEALKLLPFGIVKAEGGFGVDGMADAMGFTSGRAMVERLMGIEAQRREMRAKNDKRSVSRLIIEEETNRRMTERHGGALSDGSIQAEAMDAVHNIRQVNVLGTELRALATLAGETAAASVGTIRKWAAEAIAGKQVKDAIAVGRYAKAERDAGNAAHEALLKGDKVAAFRAKQDQLVNHALYIEAKKAAHDQEVAVRMMDNYAGAKTIKSMAQDYLDQIHNLLEDVEFKNRSAGAIDRARNFAEWAVQQQADGVDVVASQKLLTLADKTHYTEMTVSELRGLADTIKQIAHLGRLKKTLLVKGERVEFDAKVAEAVANVEALRQMKIPDARNPGAAGSGLGEGGRAMWERVKGRARSMDSSLLKMEQVFDWLDAKGGGAKGIFNSVVFRPMSEGQNLEAKLQKLVTRRLLALNKAVPKDVAREWMTRAEYPELIDSQTGKASSLLKADVIAIALNMGNASNKDKLLRGEKWDEDALKAVLDRTLTAHDWKYIQGVWDTIGELWPYIEAMEKAVNGVAPDKVEALAVETPHGTINGGYYPVVYDPARSGDVAQRAAKSADSLFENIYTRATTSRGFTNERVESYARPIHLSLDVIPRHVSEVIHDLAFREVVRQADKFLGDKRIREAVEGALGREVYDQFRPWLQNIANEWAIDRRGLGFWDSVAKGARTSASIVGMGLRMTTMMAQVTGISDATEVIGAKWMGKGLASFAGDPMRMAKTRDFVFAKSEEMANRMSTTDRDVREALRTLVGKKGLASEVKRFAFYGIGMMDMGVSLPTWMGAYEKALHQGMTDADAVFSADKAVRTSQGAGSAKDMAAMQRGTEFQKLATMFYSYFNHMYNRQRDLGRSIRDAKTGGDFAMVAARSFFLLVVPAIVGNIVGGNGPADDENVAAWAARKVGINMFMGIPIVRDAANMVDRAISGHGSNYQATPASRAVDVLAKAGTDIVRAVGLSDEDVSDDWVKHAFETTGYIFGLPTGQPGNTAQFLWDTHTGRQNPRSIADWFKGLVYGKFEEAKH